MSDAWQRIDLDGGGLQNVNRELSRRLKRRATAYRLLVMAPLGLHRSYLEHRAGAWLWRAGALAAVAMILWDARLAAVVGIAMAAAVAYEAWWVECRVTELNKRLRRQAYLRRGATPPPGFAGRILDVPAGERAPSFAEQERLLRDAARSRPDVDERRDVA